MSKREISVDLKTLRLRLGWTRQQLASHIGWDVLEVSRWEKNGVCPAEIFNSHIARILEIAESNSERTQLTPITDQELDSRGLGQIQLSKAS